MSIRKMEILRSIVNNGENRPFGLQISQIIELNRYYVNYQIQYQYDLCLFE